MESDMGHVIVRKPPMQGLRHGDDSPVGIPRPFYEYHPATPSLSWPQFAYSASLAGLQSITTTSYRFCPATSQSLFMAATKDPGHPYAQTSHISFGFHDQPVSTSLFGYEHYVSLPPSYDSSTEKSWPCILFLHGAGESQRGKNESYASLRHGVPKIILCYDKYKAGMVPPSIDIPLAPRLRGRNRTCFRSSNCPFHTVL